MRQYIVDQDGTKEVQGNFRLLYVGNESEEYKKQRELEEQLRLEEEANRPPTKEELLEQELANTNALILELTELILGGM